VRRRSRLAEALFRAALFVLPFAIAFVYVVTLLAVLTVDEWRIVFGGMATYLVAPVGTEVVIPAVFIALLAVHAAWPVFVIAATSVVLVDVLTALFFLWNWDLIERVPRVGRILRRVEDKCRQVIEKRRWGGGATLMALALYVALPFQMTGGLFGSVLGRVMGLNKIKVFLAVTAGSIAGAVPLGIVAYLVGPPVLAALESPSAQTFGLAAGILITVAFVGAVVLLYRRGRRNAD